MPDRPAAPPSEETAYERCPRCGGDARDTWFDRSLCPCDGTNWGVMHQRCSNCGFAEDCKWDNPRGAVQ